MMHAYARESHTRKESNPGGTLNKTSRLVLLVIIVILVIALLPTWPYSSGWGYYPSGGLGLILLILLLLIVLDKL